MQLAKRTDAKFGWVFELNLKLTYKGMLISHIDGLKGLLIALIRKFSVVLLLCMVRMIGVEQWLGNNANI